MKINVLVVLVISLLLPCAGMQSAFALEHIQKDGLFSMEIPEAWHWVENPQEVIITYPDGNTVAIDIELAPSHNLSQAQMKKMLNDADDKMIKEGILAHNGTLIDRKETVLGSNVHASQLDFKTTPPNPIEVTYISFFYKNYVFTITYGSTDDKMRSVMDDAVASMKLR